jgi:hypothetical protein
MVVKQLVLACQPSTDSQWVIYNTEEDATVKSLKFSRIEFKEEYTKLGLTPREYINKLINNG